MYAVIDSKSTEQLHEMQYLSQFACNKYLAFEVFYTLINICSSLVRFILFLDSRIVCGHLLGTI